MTIAFHWLVAASVAGQLVLGWWMRTVPKSPPGLRAGWFNLHKSIGLTIALVVLAWLLARRRGDAADPLPRWQRIAARVNHALLLATLLALAVSGYLGSSFTAYPVLYFGRALPQWGHDWPAGKEAMSTLHLLAVWLLMSLLVLHIAAALWHWFNGHASARRIGLPRLRGS
ncbi:cytochrome b [Caenimonas terrae]|uniref:Cytochrome b n=1 Tax=Caenimonas terrae TaxID=696074 RepID=A0ABW0NGS6_9BURK